MVRLSYFLSSATLVSLFGCSSSSGGGAPADLADAALEGSADGASTEHDGGGSGGAGKGDSGAAATTALTGTLGSLGSVKPTVSSFVIANSGETLLYLTSATLTCSQLMTSRWLGAFTSDSQVVELVVRGAAKVGTIHVGSEGAEVNYAAGGKSSSYEIVASAGSITFTMVQANGPVEGSVSATYADGSSVTGSFHAEFCDGGQGY